MSDALSPKTAVRSTGSPSLALQDFLAGLHDNADCARPATCLRMPPAAPAGVHRAPCSPLGSSSAASCTYRCRRDRRCLCTMAQPLVPQLSRLLTAFRTNESVE